MTVAVSRYYVSIALVSEDSQDLVEVRRIAQFFRLLRIVKLFRIIRIFKLARHVGALKALGKTSRETRTGHFLHSQFYPFIGPPARFNIIFSVEQWRYF